MNIQMSTNKRGYIFLLVERDKSCMQIEVSHPLPFTLSGWASLGYIFWRLCHRRMFVEKVCSPRSPRGHPFANWGQLYQSPWLLGWFSYSSYFYWRGKKTWRCWWWERTCTPVRRWEQVRRKASCLPVSSTCRQCLFVIFWLKHNLLIFTSVHARINFFFFSSDPLSNNFHSQVIKCAHAATSHYKVVFHPLTWGSNSDEGEKVKRERHPNGNWWIGERNHFMCHVLKRLHEPWWGRK